MDGGRWQEAGRGRKRHRNLKRGTHTDEVRGAETESVGIRDRGREIQREKADMAQQTQRPRGDPGREGDAEDSSHQDRELPGTPAPPWFTVSAALCLGRWGRISLACPRARGGGREGGSTLPEAKSQHVLYPGFMSHQQSLAKTKARYVPSHWPKRTKHVRPQKASSRIIGAAL